LHIAAFGHIRPEDYRPRDHTRRLRLCCCYSPHKVDSDINSREGTPAGLTRGV